MNYYQDITILPDADIGPGFLWKKIYQQVHLALVEHKGENGRSEIAVSFPEYRKKVFPLGSKVRLHASTMEKLESLDIQNWLSKLSDYCHIASIKTIPEQHSLAVFRRKPIKSIENKAKRRAKHLGISFDDALEYLKNEGRSKPSKLPFVLMESQSSGKRTFSLFIDAQEAQTEVKGDFDCYGLSNKATVPVFG
jgi:CRISPR-associated endonuclease Csy4